MLAQRNMRLALSEGLPLQEVNTIIFEDLTPGSMLSAKSRSGRCRVKVFEMADGV